MSLAKWFPFKFSRKSEDNNKQSSTVPVKAPPADRGTGLAAFGPDPFDLMRDMLNEPLFADPFGGFGRLERWFGDHSPRHFLPRVDVVDRGTSIEVTAELPGLTKDDVKISVTEDALTLSGDKRVESESKEDGCYRVERAYGSFRRVLPLPKEVDRDKVDATFKDGVLTISLPKTTEGTAARKIVVH